MALSAELVETLVCPESRSKLLYFAGGDQHGDEPFLFCPESRLKYRIDDGIPVLLIEEAERLEQAEAERLRSSAAGG